MAYSLKDNVNEWVKMDISIDNENGTASLFINGIKQNFSPGANTSVIEGDLAFTERITKEVDSGLTIGGKRNGGNKFVGKLDGLNIDNKLTNTLVSRQQYFKTKYNSAILNIYANVSSETLEDKSKYKSTGILSDAAGFSFVTDESRDAMNFLSGEYIELDSVDHLNGDTLNNSTFVAWIKPTLVSNTFEPILSRTNAFSFGLNNGHAALFLGKDNQLVPGTNIKKEEAPSSLTSSVYNVLDKNDTNKVVNADFNSDQDTVLITGGIKEYSDIVPGSQYVKVTTDDTIIIDKKEILGKNLDDFSYSGWVNFKSFNSDATLFQREDIGLKLFADAEGVIKLEYKVKA